MWDPFKRCRQEVQDDPGSVAFVRWYILRTRWLTICLHKFLKSDHWAAHNHEYDSISIVLWGKYTEMLGVEGARQLFVQERPRWWPFGRKAWEFHIIRIERPPVWTLFFQYNYQPKGFRVGYLVEGRLIPQELYDAIKRHKTQRLSFKGWLFPRVTAR